MNFQTSHEKLCEPENNGMTHLKCYRANLTNAEFYGQRKCPSKIKVKYRLLQMNKSREILLTADMP
jgi:hypothetical protein